MNVGSDTFPRDEVTGLAAFDHLDPVSTVSTLNTMPELAAPPPRVFTPPPPPMSASVPPRMVSASVPPPVMRTHVSVTPTLPPPAAHASRTVSRLPEAPSSARASLPPSAAAPSNTLRADATEVMDLADADSSGGYESWEDPEDAATRIARPMSDGNPAHSADLQMDWDDEEPPTQMRGEGGVQQPRPIADVQWEAEDLDTRLRDDGATSAYQPAQESGRPSPFPSVRPSSAGSQATPSVRSGAPSPFVTSESETAWGQELRGERPAYWIIGAAAVAIVGAAFALRAFFAAPTPGLITLTTVPSTARVIVDGKPVAGSSSPFTATDLAPGVSHTLIVQKDGFLEQQTTFTLADGESKTLSEIKLAAAARDVGFVISSSPAGAEVRIDGQASGQVTPARLTNVTPGLHKLALVREGYAPFEINAFVPEDKVLELPIATLVASAAAGKPSASAAAPEATRRSSSSSSRHHHRDRVAKAAAPKASKRTRVAAAPRQTLKAAAPTSGKGVLRVNSRPWAQVFVDGKLMGNTPQMNIQLPPGDHKLKLVNGPMGLTKTLSVNVKNGQTVTKVLNLIE